MFLKTNNYNAVRKFFHVNAHRQKMCSSYVTVYHSPTSWNMVLIRHYTNLFLLAEQVGPRVARVLHVRERP